MLPFVFAKGKKKKAKRKIEESAPAETIQPTAVAPKPKRAGKERKSKPADLKLKRKKGKSADIRIDKEVVQTEQAPQTDN